MSAYEFTRGDFLGYGNNNLVKEFEGVARRISTLNYLLRSTASIMWAESMGFIRETELSVAYNKNYVVTKEAISYYESENLSKI